MSGAGPGFSSFLNWRVSRVPREIRWRACSFAVEDFLTILTDYDRECCCWCREMGFRFLRLLNKWIPSHAPLSLWLFSRGLS